MSSLLTEELISALFDVPQGEHIDVRARLQSLWDRLDAMDHFHRCVLAHYMADLQNDPHKELHWDQLALQAAKNALPGEFDHRFPGMTLASFFPSLHLNVAASLERVGQLDQARVYADLAHNAALVLTDSPLSDMTIRAITRIRSRLCLHHDACS